MRRFGAVLLAFAVMAAVTTAPARASSCGRPAVTAGCCCKHKPTPPKAPCCQAAPATSDAAVLSGMTALAPDLAPIVVALVADLPTATGVAPLDAVPAASPPGSPPVFLLDCSFRI
jgi:hypothetical protein